MHTIEELKEQIKANAISTTLSNKDKAKMIDLLTDMLVLKSKQEAVTEFSETILKR